MTFKQLEALFWVAQLGGFQAASLKLHTAQSAITKRIQELESQLDVELFDRSERSARLTDKGYQLVSYAKRLLDLRDEAVLQVGNPAIVERTLKLGVTELTAMTWLSTLIAELHAVYPHVRVEPDVDASVNLRVKLLADEIDLMIVPNAFDDARFVTEPVGEAELVWMCKPGLVVEQQPMNLSELSRYPMLANRSGPGMFLDRWFTSVGFKPQTHMTSNSIVSLLSLAVAGLGVTYVQSPSFRHLVDAGLLQQLDVTPALPLLPYAAVYKTSRISDFMSTVVRLSAQCFQFSEMLPIIGPTPRHAT
ncbi:LysR family transcriptional regulator [Paraburkholderia bannensis]|uniref:LysR family transcriptional regulator n=1 Tax=Paraburkholderia bannensis TaxID=765414 RepID=UPI002ABD742D|nr:LysR family transcriptional regulator [Paraburkholderia bannensis]